MSENKSVLNEEEAALVEAQFRDELKAEHDSRQEAQAVREQRSRGRAARSKNESQILAEQQLKQEVRETFYRENDYKLYTDSAGREHWLTTEEYEWRMRARARHDRNRRRFVSPNMAKKRQLLMYGGAAILAILMGLILLK
jgi:hypothetical protein